MIALALFTGIACAAFLGAYIAGVASDVVRAAVTDYMDRRDDVATVRSLQPPPRDAVTTYPEYSDAAMDAMAAELERGA